MCGLLAVLLDQRQGLTLQGDVIVVAEWELPADSSVTRAGRVCPAAKGFVQCRPGPP